MRRAHSPPPPPPSSSSTSASPAPSLTLKRVSTVCRVLRFLRFVNLHTIIKVAHISVTFCDALESYSATVWRRIPSQLDSWGRLEDCFLRDEFAWVAHSILAIGEPDVSAMTAHPLHLAAEHGAVSVVQVCLAVMPECVDVRNREATALHFASVCGHTECVRELLAAGADIAVTSGHGLTALHAASYEGKVGVLRLLVAHADFTKIRDMRNGRGATALRLASFRGHAEVVCELLAAGADVTVSSDAGRTALDGAAVGGHADIVRLLAAHAEFAKIRDVRDADNGLTALLAACFCVHNECVRELLAVGADITVADIAGYTALHVASQAGPEGNIDVVRMLVTHADFAKLRDARNDNGKTAMDLAKTDEIKQLLLSNANT